MTIRRPFILSTRVTERELAYCDRLAKAAKMSRADWLHELVRQTLLESLKTEQTP